MSTGTLRSLILETDAVFLGGSYGDDGVHPTDTTFDKLNLHDIGNFLR